MNVNEAVKAACLLISLAASKPKVGCEFIARRSSARLAGKCSMPSQAAEEKQSLVAPPALSVGEQTLSRPKVVRSAKAPCAVTTSEWDEIFEIAREVMTSVDGLRDALLSRQRLTMWRLQGSGELVGDCQQFSGCLDLNNMRRHRC